MTAEIAIINKGAVVLAADSAVTITVGGSEKIYNSVNKIFDLTMSHPIGVMVYGNLEFMGVPFETLIKMYRRERTGSSFPTIRDACDDFIQYLESCPHVTEEDQIKNVGYILNSRYRELYDEFYPRLVYTPANGGGLITRVNSILSERADYHIRALRRSRRQPGMTSVDEERIFSAYKETHEEVVESVFGPMRLYANTQAKLRDLSRLWLVRQNMSQARTGIVIAGFGAAEIFPALVNIEIEGIIAGRLKRREAARATITKADSEGADIIPFAQKEMVERFLRGVDPDFEAYSFQQFRELLTAAGRKILEENFSGGEEEKADALRGFTKFVQESIASLRKKTDDFKDQGFRKKVLDMVIFMPKQELANMAESLINLTSLKRRVSAERETVGGPVDVAVISKDEGFVWIKRKHYFDGDLNPRYLVRLRDSGREPNDGTHTGSP